MLPSSNPPVEYATKADLRELRQELKSDLREIRLELKADIAELKADVQKTVIIALLGVTAIFGTLVTILKLFA